jgi:hypothetical protein
MLVNCAECTLIISSSTRICPRCGHEHGPSRANILSDFVFGDIERRAQSDHFERLLLATVICIFSACIAAVVFLVDDKLLAVLRMADAP